MRATDTATNISGSKSINIALKSLPNEWKRLRLRFAFEFTKGITITKENLKDEGIFCLNYGEIHSKYPFECNPDIHPLRCVDKEYMNSSPNSKLRYGDYIFADTSEDIEGSGNFSCFTGKVATMAGYHTVIARSRTKENFRFYAYLFDSVTFRNQIRFRVKGVKVYSITQSILKEPYLWIPPKSEQSAIANFLDDKSVKIDQAITQKEMMIELLQERKQIIIQNAVTKGLDSKVKMKDSGVDWIGEIPKHWKVKRLKYILKERNERSVTGEEELFMMSQIHGLVVRADFHSKAQVAESSIGNKLVYKNDLVFNKLKAHLGVFFKSKIDKVGSVSPDYAIYKPYRFIEDLELLEILFRHPMYIEQFIKKATGIVEGLIRLYTEDLFDLYVPIPPKEEQIEILNSISISKKKVKKCIDGLNSQIDKLKEYKITLIDHAVTGKIKIS